jgi:hypothetical protein
MNYNYEIHAICPLALRVYKYNVFCNSKIELQSKLQNAHFSCSEAMLKFVWIWKFCEGQVVMECSLHFEKLNMT